MNCCSYDDTGVGFSYERLKSVVIALLFAHILSFIAFVSLHEFHLIAKLLVGGLAFWGTLIYRELLCCKVAKNLVTLTHFAGMALVLILAQFYYQEFTGKLMCYMLMISALTGLIPALLGAVAARFKLCPCAECNSKDCCSKNCCCGECGSEECCVQKSNPKDSKSKECETC